MKSKLRKLVKAAMQNQNLKVIQVLQTAMQKEF